MDAAPWCYEWDGGICRAHYSANLSIRSKLWFYASVCYNISVKYLNLYTYRRLKAQEAFTSSYTRPYSGPKDEIFWINHEIFKTCSFWQKLCLQKMGHFLLKDKIFKTCPFWQWLWPRRWYFPFAKKSPGCARIIWHNFLCFGQS